MGDLADDARAGEEAADLADFEAAMAAVLGSTEEPEEPTGSEFMNEYEQQIADEFYEAMMRSSRESPRGKQGQAFILGVSDIGFCPERTRRMLDGQTPEDTDVLPAFLGTAIGDHAEKAYKAARGDAVILQASVTVDFTITVDGQKWKIKVPGHPDIIDRERVLMLDAKTDFLLADPERQGPDKQKLFQRHTYGLAAWQAGLFGDVPQSEVKVGNVWIDRSGTDRYVHVDIEPLDLEAVHEAEEWLEDVVYHLVNKQAAYKAPPRQMCEVVCGYFALPGNPCRAFDVESEGLIEDDEVLSRIQMYAEGREMKSAGERLQKAAKAALEQMGRPGGMLPTGEQLVWTEVNASFVPEHTRSGYTKIDLKKPPKRPARKKS